MLTMMFQKQVILVLVAQSAALLASGFVAPAPFGGVATLQSKSAGPLFSDVVSAVSSTSEDEAAESVVEEEVVEVEPESPEAAEEDSSEDETEPPVAEADAAPVPKERLTVFVGNLPFRKFAHSPF